MKVATICRSPCGTCGYVNVGVIVYRGVVVEQDGDVKLTGGFGSPGPYRCQECGAVGAGWDRWTETLTPESRLVVAAERFRRWPL